MQKAENIFERFVAAPVLSGWTRPERMTTSDTEGIAPAGTSKGRPGTEKNILKEFARLEYMFNTMNGIRNMWVGVIRRLCIICTPRFNMFPSYRRVQHASLSRASHRPGAMDRGPLLSREGIFTIPSLFPPRLIAKYVSVDILTGRTGAVCSSLVPPGTPGNFWWYLPVSPAFPRQQSLQN